MLPQLLGVARYRVGTPVLYRRGASGPARASKGGERAREGKEGLRGEFRGYRVERRKLMNGGDLVGVNKRAPGSGSRGTREEAGPFLGPFPGPWRALVAARP